MLNQHGRRIMMRLGMMVSAAGLVLGALSVTSVPAFAEERVCRGTIGATTLDNVRVPPDARCNLNGTKVKGTIKVERNAVLVATDVLVVGNVQAENARNVIVRQTSYVGGSVQVKQGGAATVANSRVNADIQFESNRAQLRALSNRVGGNIQAFQNRGGVEIRNNRVDGNLQCKENVPPPVGGGNIVQGNKEDQCARL
jgi:hypothetical protein